MEALKPKCFKGLGYSDVYSLAWNFTKDNIFSYFGGVGDGEASQAAA